LGTVNMHDRIALHLGGRDTEIVAVEAAASCADGRATRG
jgi:hypothetical protein